MDNHIESAKNNWIYQSNKLIEASYTLTVIEQKLIRLLASMIRKDDNDFKEYKFKTKDLIKILNTSDSRFYRDIDLIKEKYSIAKESNNIKSIVAFMVSALKEDYKGPISKAKVDRFNDFQQRDYDFEQLESQLLGWGK
ncbi:replication initiation protein (plasmid) [Clostridium sp. FAM 1755]|uniref:replication initiation protein n=1 Tax=Clostridium caseinilyticum TaxID=3350403 RepID=UPI0038F68875